MDTRACTLTRSWWRHGAPPGSLTAADSGAGNLPGGSGTTACVGFGQPCTGESGAAAFLIPLGVDGASCPRTSSDLDLERECWRANAGECGRERGGWVCAGDETASCARSTAVFRRRSRSFSSAAHSAASSAARRRWRSCISNSAASMARVSASSSSSSAAAASTRDSQRWSFGDASGPEPCACVWCTSVTSGLAVVQPAVCKRPWPAPDGATGGLAPAGSHSRGGGAGKRVLSPLSPPLSAMTPPAGCLDEPFAPPPAPRPPRLPFAIGVPQNQPVVPRRGALAMRRDDVCEAARTRHCNKLEAGHRRSFCNGRLTGLVRFVGPLARLPQLARCAVLSLRTACAVPRAAAPSLRRRGDPHARRRSASVRETAVDALPAAHRLSDPLA